MTSNTKRKLARIKKAERKLVRLTARGARKRTLTRQSNRVAGLKQRVEEAKKNGNY